MLLFALVVAAFGGTAFAAVRMLDTGPSAAELRAQRATQQAAHERKQRKQKQRKRPGRSARRNGPAAAAPAAATAPPRRSRRSWAERADSVCTDAHEDSLALLERYPMRTRQEILRFLDAAVRMTGQVTQRIARLGPAPNRRVHARLMRELWASLEGHRRDVQSLRAGWNEPVLQRVVKRNRRDGVIRRLFTQLGATSCVDL